MRSDRFDNTMRTAFAAPFLSYEQERALIAAAQAGDESAVAQLVHSNIRLVMRLAFKAIRKTGTERRVQADDIAQEGVIGIMNAIKRFDLLRTNRFNTYAGRSAWQFMVRACHQSTLIRIPEHTHYNKVKKKELIEKAENAKTVSTDFELEDMIPERHEEIENESDDKEIAFNILDYVEIMDKKEAMVLRMRFGFESGKEMTLKEVGDKIGVTRERVRQIQEKALKRVRKLIGLRV